MSPSLWAVCIYAVVAYTVLRSCMEDTRSSPAMPPALALFAAVMWFPLLAWVVFDAVTKGFNETFFRKKS